MLPMSERDLKRVEVLSDVLAGSHVAARSQTQAALHSQPQLVVDMSGGLLALTFEKGRPAR